VTLSGGVITAFTDPLLIFGFGLGVYGAAWATVISRLAFLIVGLHGAVRVHNLVGRPEPWAIVGDFTPIMGIGLPAILANLATPVSAVYVTRVWSDFGEAAVAGGAIVDRVIPLAFGVVFALSASVGPIIGQNYGAKLMARVRRAIADADFVLLFCRYGGAAWVFLSCLFVANTAFNNLGFPLLSTIFNWGRATLGTIPFVTLGARWFGIEGAMVGLILGAAIFGLAGIAVAFGVTARLARELQTARA
jgi:Na+-driven multidrug efflux pump